MSLDIEHVRLVSHRYFHGAAVVDFKPVPGHPDLGFEDRHPRFFDPHRNRDRRGAGGKFDLDGRERLAIGQDPDLRRPSGSGEHLHLNPRHLSGPDGGRQVDRIHETAAVASHSGRRGEDPHPGFLEERHRRSGIALGLASIAEQHHPLEPVRGQPGCRVAEGCFDVGPALIQGSRRGAPRGGPAVKDLNFEQGVRTRHRHRTIREGHEVRVLAGERPARLPGPGDRLLHRPRRHAAGHIHHERHRDVP